MLPPPPPPPPPPKPFSAPLFIQEEPDKKWQHRIDLLVELHRTNDEYDKLKEKVSYFESIHSHLPPDSAINTKYDNLVRERDSAKAKREDLYHRLGESDSWPAGPQSQLDEKKEAQMKDVLKLSSELNSRVEEMERLIKELSHTSNTENDNDQRPSSLKRRRVDDDGIAHDVPPPPLSIPQEEIDAMQRTLSNLESQVSTLQGDLSAQLNDIKDTVQGLLDARDEEQSAISSEPSSRLNQIEGDVDNLHIQLAVLAEEMAKLILQTDEDEKQISVLMAQHEQLDKEIVTIQKRINDAEERRDKDSREIAALSAALSAHLERPPSPPASPFELEHVLPFIEQPLTVLVQNTIQSQIDQFRDGIQSKLHQQDQELYDTLWSKLELTLKMVKVVTETVKHPPTGSSS